MIKKLKHLVKMMIRSDYRREYLSIVALKKTPRFTLAHTCLLGADLELVDAASFLGMYEEITKQEMYRFVARSSSPVIIDGGANIGLSIIYFKQRYPESKIIAFEPDTQVFETLNRNMQSFELDDVELVNKALWDCETELEFMAEGADGGRLGMHQDGFAITRVPTVRLRDYLQQDVDFLKLDIEGAETKVLEDCRAHLHRVRNLFVEYHSFANDEQTLHVILDLLAKAGFRVHIHSIFSSQQPFVTRSVHFGMDLQLNIFAFRPEAEKGALHG